MEGGGWRVDGGRVEVRVGGEGENEGGRVKDVDEGEGTGWRMLGC